MPMRSTTPYGGFVLVSDVIAWFIRRVSGSPEDRRRATVVALLLLCVVCCLSILDIILCFSLGVFHTHTVILFLLDIASCIGLFVLRKTGRWRQSCIGLLFAGTIIVIPNGLSEAALGHGIYIWMVTIPLFACMILGTRWSLLFFVIVASECLVFAYLAALDSRPPERIFPELADLFMGLLVVTLTGIGFESLRAFAAERALGALREAQAASEARTEFLSTISHEIRTPLNGIIGLSRMLSESAVSADNRKLSETIVGCGESLLCILNDVLDFSKLEAGKLELEELSIDLQKIVIQTVDIFKIQAAQKKILLKYDIAKDAHEWVVGDPTRLRQILNNLISNAIKFTEGGSVTVLVSRLQDGQTEISVVDTGIGMTQAQQEKIFESFVQADVSTTRKYGGTGLGLSIVKKLVQQMNGEIYVESEPGKGSRFTCKIPFAESEAFEKSIAQKASEVIMEGKNILAVEDNPVNQMLLVRLLQRHKHQVTVVENGLQAVEKVKERDWDLILMDCEMPVMDGYEATSQIRRLGSTVPVIAMTANALKGDKEACLSAGMSDYLTKPIRQEVLLGLVQQWIASKHVG